MSADLKLVISADIDVATKQVAAFSKEVVDLGKDATTAAAGVEKLNPATSRVQTNLAKTAVAAAKFDSTIDKVKNSTNVAGQSLQNLGRIAQDAPFGFIGIQNNLNPLIESFGRLKTETGSTGGALKALAGSLAGAGGIGLAVSVVTGVLTLFAQGMFDSKESAEDLGKQLSSLGVDFDNAKREVDAFNKSIDATKALRDINLKLSVPDEAKRIEVQLGFDRQDLETKLRELRELESVSKEKSAAAFNLLLAKGSQELNDLAGTYANLNEVKKRSFDLSDKDNQLLDEAIKSENELVDIQREQEIIRININKLGSQAKLDLTEINKKEKERVKTVKTIEDVLKALGRQIGVLNQTELLFGTDESKAKISAIKTAIQTLAREFKLDPKDSIISKLFGDVAAINFKAFGIELQNSINNLKLQTSAEILIDIKQAEKEANDKLGQVKMKPVKVPLYVEDAEVIKMTEILKAAFLDLAVVVSEAVGSAIASGGNILQAALGGVLNIMGEFLVRLGKAAIVSSKLFLAIKASSSNPITGIVAGALAIVAGTILQNIKIPAFANGVTNFGGGMALVGERGPEVVRLPRGSDVIPNNQLTGITGGSSIYIPSVTLRGSDLVVVFNRANQTNSRNN
jgi:hypothetical protein